MQVLVTGATGFVGKALCSSLASEDVSVRALVRSSRQPLEHAGIEMFQGDLTDPALLAHAATGADAIVHLAARVHVMRDTAADPVSEFRRVNVEGTRALLHAAREAGVRHLVFASSVKAVGGTTTTPWTSRTTPAPVDPYGVSKLEAERLLLDPDRAGNPTVTVLRFPLIYGPGMKGNMLQLFRLVHRGWPVPVGNNGNARSILFVGNAVAAIMRILGRVFHETDLPAPSGPFFTADGPALSTAQIVDEVARALGVTSRYISLPEGPLRAIARAIHPIAGNRPGELLDRLLGSLEVDQTEFERAYDYRAPYSSSEGMDLTARWFLQS